jgi:hypothetical protein
MFWGELPNKRKHFPSMRMTLHSAWCAPVQCLGQSSAGWSAKDQMLK